MRLSKTIALAVIILSLASLTGCKPSEKNYRAAYETTMAAREADATDYDNTVYTRIRRQMKTGTAVVGGDTLAVNTQFVAVTPDGRHQRKHQTLLRCRGTVQASIHSEEYARASCRRRLSGSVRGADTRALLFRRGRRHAVAVGGGRPVEARRGRLIACHASAATIHPSTVTTCKIDRKASPPERSDAFLFLCNLVLCNLAAICRGP